MEKKEIIIRTAKGKKISVSPQEYERIKNRIELPGEHLLLRRWGGK